MKKRGYTLIELLAVIIILSIVSVIAVPRIMDVIGVSKITAYNTSKRNIIESAKLKYLADVNTSKVVEYTVDDLITDGYLKKDIKNPITNESYKETKVIISNEDGKITYDYLEGNTLYDVISILNDKDGVYKMQDEYLFKGTNCNNYVSFDKNIYRILKIDSYRNIYLLKEESIEKINKNDLEEYITSYYNDNYSELIKSNISSIDILNYNDYINSFLENESFVINNNNIWVKVGEENKVISYFNNKYINSNSANVRLVLKIKNSLAVQNGNGTQLNPYILK